MARIPRRYRVRVNGKRFHGDVLLMGNGPRHGEAGAGRKAAAGDCGIVSYPTARAKFSCSAGPAWAGENLS